jgi:Transposase DDE domain group 1
VKRTSSRPGIVVAAGGRGVVGHAGGRLLADLADATGLTAQMSEALAPLRQRDRGHDPGRVAVDVAVMLADGGEAIADLAVLREQSELFGAVASDATAWRVLDRIDAVALARIRAARARAREVAWAQAAETGRLTASTVGGFSIDGFVLDIDATVVVCHSEKESAAKTWKRTFGYHPLLCFWTPPAKPSPVCCGPVTPARTRRPITSPSSTRPWLRSLIISATAATS